MTSIFLIILATIGLMNNISSIKEYKLTMEDGSNKIVVLQKSSQYACPLYCEVEHSHHVVVCKDEVDLERNNSLHHISMSKNNTETIYCSTSKILSMRKYKTNKKGIKDIFPGLLSAFVDE